MWFLQKIKWLALIPFKIVYLFFKMIAFMLSILFFPQVQMGKRIGSKSKEIYKTNDKFKKYSDFVSKFKRRNPFKINYKFIGFATSIISIFFYQSTVVADEVLQNTNTEMKNLMGVFFPDLVEVGLFNPSYAHDDLGIYLSIVGVFVIHVATGLLLSGVLWFAVKFIVDMMMGVSNRATYSRLLSYIAVLFALSLNTTQEVHGYKVERNQVQYYMITLLIEYLDKADELATTNTEISYSSPSIRVFDPANLRHEFLNISNLYLLSLVNGDAETDTISIEFANDIYRVEFGMGGAVTLITNQSSVALNEQSTLLGQDLEKKESELIRHLIESIIDNAVAVGKKIKSIEFSGLKEDYKTTNMFNYENATETKVVYDKDYKTYCDGIYDEDLTGINKKGLQAYLEIAATCAAKTFLEEEYKNDFFNIADIYDEKYILNKGNALLFGEQTKVTYSEILQNVDKLCAVGNGYFPCAEAIQFASYRNAESHKKLGVFSPSVKVVNQLASSFVDTSDRVLKTRTFEQYESGTIAFVDYIHDERALHNVSFELNKINNVGIVADSFDLYDFTKMNIPSLSEVLQLIVGYKLTEPYERILTCFLHSYEIRNGFKCNSISQETMDLGVGMTKTSLQIFATNTAVSAFSTKSKLRNGVQLGKTSSLGGATKATAAIATSIVMPGLISAATKEDHYSSAVTAQTLTMSAFILKYFNLDFTSSLTKFSMMMGTAGIALILITVSFTFVFTLTFIAKLTELIIDIHLAPLKAFTSVLEHQEQGLFKIYQEFVAEIIYMILIIVLIMMMPLVIDKLLLSVLEQMFDILRTMQGSVENILTAMTSLLMNVLKNLMLMFMTIQFVIGFGDYQLQSIKQN
ncbi:MULTISPECIES: hypothetical protein [unclassified Vibrio]|uniref:hypothetical protein n=1 Tax=unclassified Vibrio TaxID=2614977 RepID=UPI000C8554E5|nr:MULTISPECIES: hypothetical protein [unclassified Vibrio]PMK74864.1 hypothetical protein BCT92_23750 [Vibrio sp. 10N.261.52.E5]TKF78001.1 hypothetical protein FCV65_24090 [Vibrio sp. F13]